ncbi:hypothetical protein [Actinokineospora cianjurensis]|uniref:hypothetical protein n=1 Tax=Actinokineospora cianjurensis TaxID=585224 RepID=UPI0011C403B4|nr:hypothetical protein [Actinokineospora cianjurensis]
MARWDAAECSVAERLTVGKSVAESPAVDCPPAEWPVPKWDAAESSAVERLTVGKSAAESPAVDRSPAQCSAPG